MKPVLPALAVLLALTACKNGQQNDSAAAEKGIERSVADVRAAQAAAAKPAEPSLSAGALADTARRRADALHAKTQAKAKAEQEDSEEEG